MKTAFIVHGFNMNTKATDPKYAELRAAVKGKGYKVIGVPFVWNHTTVSQFADKFVDFYETHKGSENVIIGNSYGAMVTFLTAAKLKPDKIILCSLSPFFKEDFPKHAMEYMVKRFGKRRVADTATLSADATAEVINRTNIKVIMLYGEQEKIIYPALVERVKETAKALKHAELIEAANAPHSFRRPEYVKAIAKVLS